MAPRPATGLDRRPWWTVPALSATVLLGLNVLLWNWAESRRVATEDHIFRSRADMVAREIEDDVENSADALRALRGYVQAQGTPSPAAWRAFLASLNSASRYPGIHSFQYDQRVDAAALDAFNRRAAEEGRPPVWDIQNGLGAAPRPVASYYPILLAEPPDPAILSFDSSSREDTHAGAQIPAMDSARIALGPPFRLQQAPRTWVLPMVAPVYAATPNPPSVDERRAALRGFVTLIVSPDEVFKSLGDAQLLNLAIYDGATGSKGELIFARGPQDPHARLVQTQEMAILGRTWRVEARGTAWWDGLGRKDSWQAVGSGIAISLGLLAAIAALALARERALGLADRMTRELREVNRALVDLATTDALTGVLNRRAMDLRLAEEEARAAREGRPLALITLDVDFFKHVNDKYGHPMGDVVLRNLGHLLREATRLTDHAGRMGGEEFLLVCPNTDAQGAAVVAEQLRSRFEAKEHLDGDQRIRCTASFGIAASEPGAPIGLDRLAKRADRALYQAKESGRNKVVIWVAPRAAEE